MKSAPQGDRLKLSEVKNFGPVTLAEFHAMGFETLDQLDRMGWEEVCRSWVQYFPERLNANAFIGVITALERMIWTKATSKQRALAKRMVDELRQEYSLRPVVRKSRPRAKAKKT